MSEPSGSRVIKLQDRETVKFIKLYAGERLLYDSSCKEYKDKDLRLAAARRISEAMGISGFGPKEVIAKFKNLRSSYCQELKKISDSERSGTGTDDVYVPKVIWFETMNSFIRPFVQQRPTRSNLVIPSNPSSPVSVEEESLQENVIAILSENIPSRSKSSATADTINTGHNEKMEEEPPTKFKRKATPETSSSRMKKTSQDPHVDGMFHREIGRNF